MILDEQFCTAIRFSRFALAPILDPKRRRDRTQMKEFSDSAYVHRMYDLGFCLQNEELLRRLDPKTRDACAAFQTAWDALPWRPLSFHPHVSELPADNFFALVEPAQRLDDRLALYVADTLAAIVYRFIKGWKALRRTTTR